MINIFNFVLNTLFNILLFPFQNLNPFWGIVIISLLTGIVMLSIFKNVSNQEKIHQVKNKIKAHLLELRLYNDDIELSLSAVSNLFIANFLYLLQVVKPLLFLFIPVSLILIQVGSRYGNRPLRIDEKTTISVTVYNKIPLQKVHLFGSKGVKVETHPVRFPSQNKIYWRITGLNKGLWNVTCRYDTLKVEKRVIVGKHTIPIAHSRVNKYSLIAFLNPAEKTLSKNQFLKKIKIKYPQKPIEFAGLHIHWLFLFFVLSLMFGFALKGFLGVEI